MKASQSNFNLQSPGSCLVHSVVSNYYCIVRRPQTLKKKSFTLFLKLFSNVKTKMEGFWNFCDLSQNIWTLNKGVFMNLFKTFFTLYSVFQKNTSKDSKFYGCAEDFFHLGISLSMEGWDLQIFWWITHGSQGALWLVAIGLWDLQFLLDWLVWIYLER